MLADAKSTNADYRHVREDVSRVITSAAADAAAERHETQVANEPRIEALEATRQFRTAARNDLIRRMSELSIQPRSVVSILFTLTIAVFLTGANFGLAEAVILPLQWGLAGHLFASGVAALAPFASHQLFRRFRQPWLLNLFVIGAFTSALGTLIPLAELRANQLKRTLDGGNSVVFASLEEADPTPQDDIKDDGGPIGLAMLLGTLALELGSALAWNAFLEARRPTDLTLWKWLDKQVQKEETKLLEIMVQLRELRSEPSRRYRAHWQSVRCGLADAAAQIDTYMRIGALIVTGIFAAQSLQAADTLHLVVGLDTSQTEAALGLTGHSAFEENRAAIARLLGQLPAGTRLTAVAVADRAIPSVILDAQLHADPGYLGSRLTDGRRRLVAEWNKRAAGLSASAPHTDLLGFFMFAAEALSASDARRKVIVVFSDMRNDVGVNLERPQEIDLKATMAYIQTHGLIPNLSGVEVFAVGVGEHGGKRDVQYNSGLRRFWEELLIRAQARLRMFSSMREPNLPALIVGQPGR